MKGTRPVRNLFSSSSNGAPIVRQGPRPLTRGTSADSEAHLVLQNQFELLCDKYSIGQPAKDSIIRLVARYNSGGGAEEFLVQVTDEYCVNASSTYKTKPFYDEIVKLLPRRGFLGLFCLPCCCSFPKAKFMREVERILLAHKDESHLMPENFLNGF